MNLLEFTRDDLIEEPKPHTLATNKIILVFNIRNSEKTLDLNTGGRFIYQDESFEVMNRERVDSPKNYVKFNCVVKVLK